MSTNSLIVPGQRYISQTEPQLGIGKVISISAKRFTILFPATATQRIYSIDGAPVNRVQFMAGERITDSSERSHTISSVEEKNGIYHYQCAAVILTEEQLSDSMQLTAPVERLLRGVGDDSSAFHFRYMAHLLHNDILRSPVRGLIGPKIELLPHQFYIADVVTKYPQIRILLADEVGLGKTIESCLIGHRLLLTGMIHRMLIIVPNHLVLQWFVELLRRFSIVARVFSTTLVSMKPTETLQALEDEPCVIASLEELAKDAASLQQILDHEWELLIVDEAHHGRAGSAGYGVLSQLCERIEQVILITATPHALDERSYFNLLHLLDKAKFSTQEKFHEEIDKFQTIAEYAEELLETGVLQESTVKFIARTLPASCQGMLPQPGEALKPQEARRIAAMLNDVAGIGRLLFRNSRSVVKGFPQRSVDIVVMPATNGNENSASGVIPAAILEWTVMFCLYHKNQKTLIICSSRESACLLHERFLKIRSMHCGLFHEEMSLVQLDRNAAWFSEPEGASVLVSSEIGSEGRNFQWADYLVIIDLPLDPERLEQRIGRLDRVGRKKGVNVCVPVIENSFQHLLARWYHEGLNGFEQATIGGYSVGLQFQKELAALQELAAGPPTEAASRLEGIIAKTKAYHHEILQRMEHGRNVLLELNSFDAATSQECLKLIRASESDPRIAKFMENVFDHFGILVEDMSPTIQHLNFELLNDHAFPVPMMRQSGTLCTYDRQTALARDDVEFLTMDHPMVLGALELILLSQRGNCSCVLMHHEGASAVLLECVFIVSASVSTGGSGTCVSQPLRVVIDEKGDDVTLREEMEKITRLSKNASLQRIKTALARYKEQIPLALEKAQQRARQMKDTIIESLIDQVCRDRDHERQRYEDLATRNSDAAGLWEMRQRYYQSRITALTTASLWLDSIRLIIRQ
ncbi:MAG: RNA polymerase-associated protein RapA [Chitinivibrionales bacterium]|nr:RNA polymerase-associated protein RapA [Chitinivibrionales bacterium]